MKRKLELCLLSQALLLVSAHAGLLSAGDLTVNIRNDNGAIDNLQFQGNEFFELGAHISDYGFQNGSDTATFALNNTSGSAGQPVTVTGNTVLGTYNGGGSNVDFQRSYSLVSGIPVLKVSTTFVNNGGGVTLSYFDTFDPDQGTPLGAGPGTFNDVFNLSGGTVGQARIDTGGIQRTVIAGSLDSRAIVAAGNPFNIGNGSALNSLLATPYDGNDTFADQGLHIGMQAALGAGESTSYTYYLAFGSNATEAQSNFTAAVPEPATMGLIGILSVGGWAARRIFPNV
jgi:hypothetical protein